ncbi:MAG: LacI family DNA-binding transcriptional regulator [Micromonosporaceae bacterium]|nr:LacI family DNA-binding transcriptional regulator [Micromonosporaceae bacterium]
MPSTPRRVTQRDIARLAGVSQPTVSLVLNNRAEGDVRISPETRERVLRVIRETGYVADPVARRLAARFNRIFGVFTYEPAFPSGSWDFFYPFLLGIEEAAERIGCDLLLFTSAPVVDGRRRIFNQDNRLRLADGCILLGREIDAGELRRLNEDGYRFVAIGRRDDAGGPVPYVGADYASAVGELVRLALARGHRRLGYVGLADGVESTRDRRQGFVDHTGDVEYARVFDPDAPTPRRRSGSARPAGGQRRGRVPRQPAASAETARPDTARPELARAAAVLDAALAEGITVLFVQDTPTAVAVHEQARARGLSVPGGLSIVTLGQPTTPVSSTTQFTSFRIPREEMGRRAVEVLATMLDAPPEEPVPQILLSCDLVEGSTLGAPEVPARD